MFLQNTTKKMENNEDIKRNIDKRLPFKAPEGYFDAFPQKVMERIEVQKDKKESPSILLLLKPYLMLAGVMLFFALFSFFAVKMIPKTTVQVAETKNINQLSAEETQLIEEAVYFDESDLAQSYQQQVLHQNTEQNNEIESVIIEQGLDDEDIIETADL